MQEEKVYIAIDLKSFYASVECRERNLDPLKTNLVVADPSTTKSICLAVSPSLRGYGLPGRARLFEVCKKVEEINRVRKSKLKGKEFTGKSCDKEILNSDKNLMLDYIVAMPQMAHYIKFSTEIYNIYLKYFSPEDIFIYSIDEVFIDATNYLKTYKLSAKNLATKVITDVYTKTKITATAGIGPNLYLCKVAMDIIAKHVKADKNGARVAVLNEETYRKYLWNHTPITDFWRVGKGYANRLKKYGIYTMGDIAKVAITNEDILYKEFGVNAELLIDHSFGYEPCTLEDIKKYKPEKRSLCKGQVLHCPYSYEKTRLIIKEMLELFTLELVEKKVVTNQIVLDVGYDIENDLKKYKGEIVEDSYGRLIPKPLHATININHYTASTKVITKEVINVFDKKVDKNLLTRRINITVNNAKNEGEVKEEVQLNLFDAVDNNLQEEKEKKLQKTLLNIKEKYGKNSILKGMNLEKGATTIERNKKIGGHNA